MPPPKGPIWNHFLPGEKQNGSHLCAHCRGCIEKKWLADVGPHHVAIDLDDEGNPKLSAESWVIEGGYHILVQAWASLTLLVDQHAKPELVGTWC